MSSKVFHTDTIAAIATVLSNSGIGIIRVSGSEAIQVVDRISILGKGKKSLINVDSHTIHYGHIVDIFSKISEKVNAPVIDEVIISVMKGPRSYTAEDIVEINCHGGVLVVQKVLEAVLKSGARLAEPGEFTKRAFLNGRIDLSEAEAVMDVISSKNELALKNSVKQLNGSISDKIRQLRSEIIYEIAFIESALDDPEHISLEGYPEKLNEKVKILIHDIKRLLDSYENGKMIHDGINTVIVGKPNAGKSSLLNILAGEERAIVTEIAGTTRDILEENIRLHGIGLHIIDTAGIRNTEDIVEKIGVEKARKYASDADLIIYVVDSSVPLDENDLEIINLIEDKKCIVLFNKSDLKAVISIEELKEKLNDHTRIIKTSTKENTGIEEFENALKDMFFQGDISFNDELMVTNMRHKEALQEAFDSLNEVMKSLKLDMPEDFYSIDLMNAYACLGRIIGEEIEDDLVEEIFSKFCMGK